MATVTYMGRVKIEPTDRIEKLKIEGAVRLVDDARDLRVRARVLENEAERPWSFYLLRDAARHRDLAASSLQAAAEAIDYVYDNRRGTGEGDTKKLSTAIFKIRTISEDQKQRAKELTTRLDLIKWEL